MTVTNPFGGMSDPDIPVRLIGPELFGVPSVANLKLTDARLAYPLAAAFWISDPFMKNPNVSVSANGPGRSIVRPLSNESRPSASFDEAGALSPAPTPSR